MLPEGLMECFWKGADDYNADEIAALFGRFQILDWRRTLPAKLQASLTEAKRSAFIAAISGTGVPIMGEAMIAVTLLSAR